MIPSFNHYVKSRPRLYDLLKRLKSSLRIRNPSYAFFHELSRLNNNKVRFIQIGASDGLRSDPIREFVLRYEWVGILVEPLPSVFCELKKNYESYASRLTFINAAISYSNSEAISFWTFNENFLGRVSEEERAAYLQKSSFYIEHLKPFFQCASTDIDFDSAVNAVTVPCFTLRQMVDEYWPGGNIDLLVIDAEGHERTIIPNIEFERLHPKAIFFEVQNLGEHKHAVYNSLLSAAYDLYEVEGGDAIALASDMNMQSARRYRRVTEKELTG